MAPLDDKNIGLPINSEASSSPEEQFNAAQEKDDSEKSSQSKSIKAKEYRKKKKDALQGKEAKEARGNLDPDNKGQRSEGKTKGEDGGGGGSRQSLQSGQTTVQFSSGGGANANMASSLTSLLGLFASSAALARAEGGGILNVANQTLNLTARAAFQTPNSQFANFANERGALKGGLEGATEQTAESATGKTNLGIGEGAATHGGGNTFQDAFSELIKNASAEAAENSGEEGGTSPFTISYVPPVFSYVQVFNASNFFFSPTTPFAFGNSALGALVTLPNGTTANLLVPYSGIITTYVTDTGLTASSAYQYQLAGTAALVGPLATASTSGATTPPSIYASGITFNPTSTPIAVDVSAPSPSVPITTETTGVTLTSSGDLYANVTSPISVSFNILIPTSAPGVSTSLNVRIDAGPGSQVTAPNDNLGFMVGGPSQNTILIDSTGYTMVGTDAYLTIASGTITTNGASVALPSSGVYAFPSNTLFRHVGESAQTVPSVAAYGNFDNAGGGGNIYLPSAPASDTLTMGGNVLDVFGTKYGVADILNVILPVNASGSSLPTNALTLGGNTLAGFGTSYGDLQTLQVTAQAGNSSTTLGPTDITFRGNDLAVDKSVGSVLYPHLQTLDMEQAVSSQPANVHLTFQDSLIQGNAGSDAFYGDIQNLSNLNSPTSYNGFTAEVNVKDVNGQVATTTSDGNNNSITWGNDIYNGNGQGVSPLSVTGGDTYHFTLLEDAQKPHEAVMQGNALLVNFNPQTDTLNFQISPTLFRALDGVDGQGHDKTITRGDLSASATVTPELTQSSFLSSLNAIDPVFVQYLLQNQSGASPITGAIISFDNGVGGSISVPDAPWSSFSDIPNLTTTISLIYSPVSALAAGLITASSPRTEAPFLYNNNYNGNGGIYYNELDNFFGNSLLATYNVSGGGVAFSQNALTSASPGVTIDKYGTIAVDASVPILTPLAITATDQQGATATTTQYFGFLDAPITVIPDNGTTVNKITSTSNIISGGLDATLIGEPGTDLTQFSTQPLGSNLIVDTTGGALAYGDFQGISLAAQATQGDVSVSNHTLTLGPNALYVTNAAAIYGDAPTFDITAQGGVVTQSGGGLLPITYNPATADFDANAFLFGSQTAPQTIYGSIESAATNPAIYGDMQTLNISDIGGSDSSPHHGSFAAASVTNNTFTFGPVNIIVLGDSASQTTDIYPNLQNLSITVESTASVGSSSNAAFSGNKFIFEDATVTGGAGNINVYGTIGLNVNNTSPYAYNELADGVTTSSQPDPSNSAKQQLITTTSDGQNNAIFWGNDTFTGGHGSNGNTYNFTLLYNPTGSDANGVSTQAVFTGNDVITNFNPALDKLEFTLEPGIASSSSLATFATFTYDLNNDTVIAFNSPNGINGTLTLEGVPLASSSPSIVMNGTTIVDPTVNAGATFDPVFANTGNIQQALSVFVNNPSHFSMTYAGTLVDANGSAPSNVGLDSSTGGLNVSSYLAAPVDFEITNATAQTTVGTTPITLPLPDVHVFASNASSVTHDSTSDVINGTLVNGIAQPVASQLTAAAAYEVTKASTVYGGGEDIALPNNSNGFTYGSKLIDDASAVTHAIYGDVQNITYDGSVGILGPTFTFEPTLITVNFGSSDQIFGNAQNLNLSIPSSSSMLFRGNTFTFHTNTIYGSGSIYGDIQTITLDDASQSSQLQTNHFNFGGNALTSGAYLNGSGSLTPSGTADILYGDAQSLLITGEAPSGAPGITGNTFNFGANALTGGSGGGSLYAGIGVLEMANTQATPITGNSLTFQDSVLTGNGGATEFYGDINDLSHTNFYNYGVTATTSNSHVQITDTAGVGTASTISGNMITFGNDKMIGSAAGNNTFNLDLLATQTSNNAVAEGNTTITNFGASNTNMLDLRLSQALYDDILAENGAAPGSPITAPMLDNYMHAYPNNISFMHPSGTTDTVIGFSDGPADTTHIDLGSITLTGVTIGSFSDLGSNLAITVGDPITMDTSSNAASVFNVTVPGNAIPSFTENLHVADISSLGNIVDFSGTVDLSMSTALFKALGLSDSNTPAQNLQALENDANTAAGGIAVSQTTTGAGANAVTNTVLTFESTTNGVVNTYGSLTLHDTHFNPSDPLSAHLLVIHH